jgi:hypothetical protein
MYTVVSDYYGTGEGRTIMMCICRGFPDATHPKYDTETDPKFWALESFKKQFGEFYTYGADLHEGLFLDFEGAEFLISDQLRKSLTQWQSCANLFYAAKFHFNFS